MNTPTTLLEVDTLIAYHRRILETTRSEDRQARARRAIDRLERQRDRIQTGAIRRKAGEA